MKDYTARILRAIRKYYGTTQIDFSSLLGVRQGTLSKLEAGKLELSAIQWIELSSKYLLDPTALITGRIEAIGPLEIRLHNGSKIGNFKIHKRYLTAMGSTVRTVYPFIQFLVAKVGQEKAAEFFKSKKVDPDYFIIQNLPINILIIKDIFDYLNQQGHLSKNNVGEILKVSPVSEIHGYVVSNLKESQSAEINLRRFTKLVQEYYEINSHYHFEGDANSFIQVRDNYHLKDFKLGDEFNMFRMLYNLENYNQLAPVLSGDQEFTVEAVAGGWDLKLK